jgi:hypothetical protein
MTKAAKITYFSAWLIGLSIGAFFGFQTAAPALKAYYSGRQLIAPMVLSHFSYLQYSYADPAHAQAALQTSARLLEEIEKLNPEETQERELSFTYTRLALLEDAADKSEQSHALMTKARYWYAVSGGRDYSESEMKTMLKTLDEQLQP